MAVISFPNFNSKVVNNEDYFLPVWIRFFQDIWRRIGGQRDLKLGGALNIDVSIVGNIGSGEDDLMTYTLAPNSLNATGDYLEIIAYGTLAPNNNNKILRLKFGNNILYNSSNNPTPIAGAWYFKAYIVRATSSTQKIITSIHSNSPTFQDDTNYSADYTGGIQDLTTSQIIKCTGTGIATNDIVQEAMIIKYYSNT